LRERKKRLLRRRLSDTATQLFLERGFDNVRIADIAEACDVSEKTVFNYFPTKESLILDRWQSTPAALLHGLADPTVAPIEAVLRVLDNDLAAWTSWYAELENPDEASSKVRRFVDMIYSTPSLRAYERDMSDQLVAEAAKVLAARIGKTPDDPEPRIVAAALVELWRVQDHSVRQHLETRPTPTQIRDRVSGDVQRAAQLISDGLASFNALKPASPRRSRNPRA
jgi:AcrR family transcriptional regulator